MTIPIKIECECGQHYAFDVEPLNGRMPSSITCPACGADGTIVANEVISGHLAARPAASPIRLIETPKSMATASNEAVIPVSIPPANHPATLSIQHSPGTTPPPVLRRDPRLGQVDRSQAEHEARAKMMWGDSKDEVIKYLMIQGFSAQEALPIVEALFLERAKTIRANGIQKIFIGIGLVCVPIITLVAMLTMGMILIKILSLTVMVGLYGGYLVLKGILMALAPKSELGDVNEQ
jgi:hypothetical protein